MDIIESENNIFYVSNITGDLPLKIRLNGKTYYRFCDFIYIPTFTEKLTPEQVKTVSEIRENYFNIFDQFKINSLIREDFRQFILLLKPSILLEIGPGKNPLIDDSFDFIETLYLVDFRDDIVKHLGDKGLNSAYFYDSVPLNLDSDSVDCIIAIFVFQFNITINQIQELYRVLNPGGIIIANVYRRSLRAKTELLERFTKQGFSHYIVSDPKDLCKGHEYWLFLKNRNSSKLKKVLNYLSK